jgi:hypothetical protein
VNPFFRRREEANRVADERAQTVEVVGEFAAPVAFELDALLRVALGGDRQHFVDARGGDRAVGAHHDQITDRDHRSVDLQRRVEPADPFFAALRALVPSPHRQTERTNFNHIANRRVDQDAFHASRDALFREESAEHRDGPALRHPNHEDCPGTHVRDSGLAPMRLSSRPHNTVRARAATLARWEGSRSARSRSFRCVRPLHRSSRRHTPRRPSLGPRNARARSCASLPRRARGPSEKTLARVC